MKILIACKDGGLGEYAAFGLEKAGYDVIPAGNGSHALEIILFKLPDLIIIDQFLEVIAPEKIVRILRSNPRTWEIPIIILGRERRDFPWLNDDLDDFLAIPLNPDELIFKVSGILGTGQMKDGKFIPLSGVIPFPESPSSSDEARSGKIVENDIYSKYGKITAKREESNLVAPPIPRDSETTGTTQNVLKHKATAEDEKAPTFLPTRKIVRKAPHLELEKEMVELYQAIESLIALPRSKVIQFIGSKEGEGTSTIVREFARVMAEKGDKSVLLMDADYDKPSQHLFFDVEPDLSLEEVIKKRAPLARALSQVSNAHLYVNLISRSISSTLQIFNSRSMPDFFEILRKRFDLILIDTPPATHSPESLIFSSRVDGVVLVVEAERTRWMVAKSVKNRIVKNGGNILGVVFNKKKNHIPDFIYKRL